MPDDGNENEAEAGGVIAAATILAAILFVVFAALASLPGSHVHLAAIGPEAELARAQSELEAQWIMAWAGLAQVVIGAVGLAGLVATVVVARRAWKQSQRSARAAVRGAVAARESVKVTREVGQAQVRAYVSLAPIGVTLRRMPGANVEDSVPEIVIKIENAGSSPALNYVWSTRIIWAARGLEYGDVRGGTRLDEATYRSMPGRWGKDIAAGASNVVLRQSNLGAAITPIERKGLESGTLTLFVSVETMFLDVFNTAVGSEHHFIAQFPATQFDVSVPLHNWPNGVDWILEVRSAAEQFAAHSRAASDSTA